MAIFAEVKFRRLVANATSRKIYVEASRRTFAAVISERNLVLDTSYRALAPEIRYQRLHATPNWRNLFLHDVHVNPEQTIFYFANEFGFSDAVSLSPEPSYSDAVGVSDQNLVFGFGRGLLDLEILTDAISTNANKVNVDSYSVSDSLQHVMAFNRSHDDAVIFSDAPEFDVSSALADSSSIGESAAISMSRSVADSTAFSDSPLFHPTKGEADSVSVAEDLIYSAGLGKNETISVTELLTVTRSPFSFEFSFGDGFTNVAGSPDDQFSFTDSQTMGIEFALQDFFTLDDFNQIDKESLAFKFNIYTIQDEHAVTFGKLVDDAFTFADPAVIDAGLSKSDSVTFADDESIDVGKIRTDSYSVTESSEKIFGKSLQDSTNPLTDNAIFAFTKAASDNIITSEVHAFSVSKLAQDSIAVSDTPVLSPRIGKSDSVTVSDVLVTQKLVASAVLNKGDMGFMLLNAD